MVAFCAVAVSSIVARAPGQWALGPVQGLPSPCTALTGRGEGDKSWGRGPASVGPRVASCEGFAAVAGVWGLELRL